MQSSGKVGCQKIYLNLVANQISKWLGASANGTTIKSPSSSSLGLRPFMPG